MSNVYDNPFFPGRTYTSNAETYNQPEIVCVSEVERVIGDIVGEICTIYELNMAEVRDVLTSYGVEDDVIERITDNVFTFIESYSLGVHAAAVALDRNEGYMPRARAVHLARQAHRIAVSALASCQTWLVFRVTTYEEDDLSFGTGVDDDLAVSVLTKFTDRFVQATDGMKERMETVVADALSARP